MKSPVKLTVKSSTLFLFLLAFYSSAKAFEVRCVKTTAKPSIDCNHVLVHFDFSGCGEESGFPISVDRRSKCVNGKAVAFVKNKSDVIIATYGASGPVNETPQEWKYLSLRREELANRAMVIQVVPTLAQAKAPEEPLPETKVESVTISPQEIENKMNVPEAKIENKTEEKGLDHAEIKPLKNLTAESEKGVEAKLSGFAKGVKISGLVDAYYLWDSTNPAPVSVPSGTASSVSTMPASNVPLRLFDNYHDTLSLNLAQLSFEKKTEIYETRLDLGYGNFATIFSPNDIVSQNVIRAYITYRLSSDWHLTVGKFYSPMGAEEPLAAGNMNYSRSLLFNYAIPLWNTGIALEYSIDPEKVLLTFFVLTENGGSIYESNRSKTLAVNLEVKDTDFRFHYTYQVGSDALNVSLLKYYHEANIKWKASEDWDLMWNGVYGLQNQAVNGSDASWTAEMVGVRWHQGKDSISPRYEIYSDPAGFSVYGLSGAVTLSPGQNYLSQNLTSLTLTWIREIEEGAKVFVELRKDTTDQPVIASGYSQLTTTIATTLEF